jgi:hypothetical protein
VAHRRPGEPASHRPVVVAVVPISTVPLIVLIAPRPPRALVIAAVVIVVEFIVHQLLAL